MITERIKKQSLGETAFTNLNVPVVSWPDRLITEFPYIIALPDGAFYCWTDREEPCQNPIKLGNGENPCRFIGRLLSVDVIHKLYSTSTRKQVL